MTLSLYRLDGVASRAWAYGMMGAARLPLSRIPGLTFWKLCGAGVGEGFTPRLDMSICGILCVWDSRAAAEAALGGHALFAKYRAHAVEDWTVWLTPRSSRGAWSGQAPFVAGAGETDGPLAVLTRATLRPRALPFFWREVPDVSAAIGSDHNVLFKLGLGEVPFMQQITFSIWPDAAAMQAFARKGGPHEAAIKAVRRGDWFAEELYARFNVIGADGAWEGGDPLRNAFEVAA